eukprot:m.95251 g.95251  ORF g.95251 m.95251 type:complete len:462 (-) comp26802_c1_seq1:633-2018(-)
MSTIVQYRAKHAFKPEEEDELELKVGDIVETYVVKKDENWGTGKNLSSGKSGSFPWTYVNVIETNAAPQLPPKPRSASTSNSRSYQNVVTPGAVGGEDPLPPIQPRGRQQSVSYVNFPWYAGPMGRPDVQKQLQDCPDGTYLVRTSASRPGYTLSIKFSEIRHIIIIERGGKFGFSEPTSFDSLLDLIKYFQNDSLACYNAELETKLTYPYKEAPSGQEEENVEDAIEEEALYVANRVELRNQMKKGKYTSLPRRTSVNEATEQDVYVKIKVVNSERRAQRMIVELLTEQKQLLEKKVSQRNLQQADENVLKENLKMVKRRLVDSDRNMKRIESKVASVASERETIRASVSEDRRRASTAKLNVNYDDNLDRPKAEELLEGKEDGKYLIRKSNRENDPFTLSMRFQGITRHIQIKFDGKRYGLAEPLAFFSIGKLCEYYTTCELSSTITKKLTECINLKQF